MRIINILEKKAGSRVISSRANAPLLDVVKLLGQHKIGAILVVDAQGKVRGTLTEREIARAVGESGPNIFSLTAADVMNRAVLTCRPDDKVADVLALMSEKRMTHLLVLSERRLVGIVSWRDVIKERLGEVEADVVSLRDYISGAYVIGDDGDNTIGDEEAETIAAGN